MAKMNVKKTSDHEFTVFGDSMKPLRLKLHKEKDKYWLECTCFMYRYTKCCMHCEAVMKFEPSTEWRPLRMNAQVVPEEYVGGNLSDQILKVLKSVTY